MSADLRQKIMAGLRRTGWDPWTISDLAALTQASEADVRGALGDLDLGGRLVVVSLDGSTVHRRVHYYSSLGFRKDVGQKFDPVAGDVALDVEEARARWPNGPVVNPFKIDDPDPARDADDHPMIDLFGDYHE